MKNAFVARLLSFILCFSLNLWAIQPSCLASETELNKTRAALLCIPGLTQHSSTYEQLSRQMAEFKIETIALDVQGFQASERGEKQEPIDFERTVDQVKLRADLYKRNNPNTPVFVLGESTGGTIALKLAAKYPGCVDGILCSAPTWKVNDRNKIAFLELLDLTVFRWRKHGLAVNYVIRRTTKNKALQAHLKDEVGRRQRFSIGESVKFMRFINASPKTVKTIESTPVFVVHGLNDRLGQTKWTARLFNKIKTSQKTLVIDCNAEHLICEEGQCSKPIIEAIKNWIDKSINQEVSLHPEGLLLSSDGLGENKIRYTRDLFKLAGVKIDTTLAQDFTRESKEATP